METKKILIAGGGEIGYHLAQILSMEAHEVTLIDKQGDVAGKAMQELDVRVVPGDATSIDCLRQAGIEDTEVMIAVTSVDEVNILASLIAKKVGVREVIGRVRNTELTRAGSILRGEDLGMTEIIHPEEQAAQEILMLLKRSAASDIENLAGGRLQVVGIRLEAPPGNRNSWGESCIVGKTVQEYDRMFPEFDFNVVAISRRGTPIMARGRNRLENNDQVFILAKKEDIPRVIETTGRKETDFSSVMIAEGSGVGERVMDHILNDPDLAEKRWNVKMIIQDEERARKLSEKYHDRAMVLHGNPTDPDLLNQEGFSDSDAYLALTDDEESNIISCLMAKHLKARKVVALISKKDYINISQTIGLDAAVNTKLAAANAIHRVIRRGNVLSITSLHGIAADAIEVEVKRRSRVAGKKVKKIEFPGNAVVGAVLKEGGERVEIATGDTVLEPGDRVILFTLPRYVISVAELFK